MSLDEKTLICRDCSQNFAFSVGEQEFFLKKGLKNEPKRCPNCRLVMRVQRNGDDINRTCEVPCASCNIATRVPFKPKGYRPVYCVGCFQSKKKEESELAPVAELQSLSEAHPASELQPVAEMLPVLEISSGELKPVVNVVSPLLSPVLVS